MSRRPGLCCCISPRDVTVVPRIGFTIVCVNVARWVLTLAYAATAWFTTDSGDWAASGAIDRLAARSAMSVVRIRVLPDDDGLGSWRRRDRAVDRSGDRPELTHELRELRGIEGLRT